MIQLMNFYLKREYLILTGEWIYLNQPPSQYDANFRSRTRNPSISSVNSSKYDLNGSQIIKLSLFPSKKKG